MGTEVSLTGGRDLGARWTPGGACARGSSAGPLSSLLERSLPPAGRAQAPPSPPAAPSSSGKRPPGPSGAAAQPRRRLPVSRRLLVLCVSRIFSSFSSVGASRLARARPLGVAGRARGSAPGPSPFPPSTRGRPARALHARGQHSRADAGLAHPASEPGSARVLATRASQPPEVPIPRGRREAAPSPRVPHGREPGANGEETRRRRKGPGAAVGVARGGAGGRQGALGGGRGGRGTPSPSLASGPRAAVRVVY